jgi:hypothetical protein
MSTPGTNNPRALNPAFDDEEDLPRDNSSYTDFDNPLTSDAESDAGSAHGYGSNPLALEDSESENEAAAAEARSRPHFSTRSAEVHGTTDTGLTRSGMSKIHRESKETQEKNQQLQIELIDVKKELEESEKRSDALQAEVDDLRLALHDIPATGATSGQGGAIEEHHAAVFQSAVESDSSSDDSDDEDGSRVKKKKKQKGPPPPPLQKMTKQQMHVQAMRSLLTDETMPEDAREAAKDSIHTQVQLQIMHTDIENQRLKQQQEITVEDQLEAARERKILKERKRLMIDKQQNPLAFESAMKSRESLRTWLAEIRLTQHEHKFVEHGGRDIIVDDLVFCSQEDIDLIASEMSGIEKKRLAAAILDLQQGKKSNRKGGGRGRRKRMGVGGGAMLESPGFSPSLTVTQDNPLDDGEAEAGFSSAIIPTGFAKSSTLDFMQQGGSDDEDGSDASSDEGGMQPQAPRSKHDAKKKTKL